MPAKVALELAPYHAERRLASFRNSPAREARSARRASWAMRKASVA